MYCRRAVDDLKNWKVRGINTCSKLYKIHCCSSKNVDNGSYLVGVTIPTAVDEKEEEDKEEGDEEGESFIYCSSNVNYLEKMSPTFFSLSFYFRTALNARYLSSFGSPHSCCLYYWWSAPPLCPDKGRRRWARYSFCGQLNSYC